MRRVVTQRELCNDSGEIVRRLDQGEAFLAAAAAVAMAITRVPDSAVVQAAS
jgi:hypothetical protein